MIGAILGDIIGSPFEFDKGDKTKDFKLFTVGARWTDDSVMTLAVAEALMNVDRNASDNEIRDSVVYSMRKWGRKYSDIGYGGRFLNWLTEEHPTPYGSYGNGSAMRVSSAGWLYDSLERTRHVASLTADVTHNHIEGIKGAEATAAAIFMARTGIPKEEIKEYIVREFRYNLDRTLDEIRPGYHHVASCQQTVPEAVTAFLEGEDFEDVIRCAVSLGGDCDTLTCIAGSIAEAYYGVPDNLRAECKKRADRKDMKKVMKDFEEVRLPRKKRPKPEIKPETKNPVKEEKQEDPQWVELLEYYKGQNAAKEQSVLVEFLREAQQLCGGVLTNEVMDKICTGLNLKASYLSLVMKYAPDLKTEKAGHRLTVCGGKKCTSDGNDKLRAYIEKNYGAKNGCVCEKGGFTYKVGGCMKKCKNGPCVQWDGEVYTGMTPAKLEKLIGKK